MAHHLAQRGAGEELEADHRGDRVAGEAERGAAVDVAERQRLRRLDGDLHPVDLADLVEHPLDEVELAHRHAARRHQRVAAAGAVLERGRDQRLVVADEAEVDRLAAGLRQQRQERAAVGVADLPRRQRGGALDQLVPGRHHADTGPRVGDHLDDPERGQHAEVGRAEDRPGRDDDVAGAYVVAGGADVVTRTGAGAQLDGGAVGREAAVLHHHQRVGAGRQRRPGHDPYGLARPDLLRGRGTGGEGRPPPPTGPGVRGWPRRRPRPAPRSRPPRCWGREGSARSPPHRRW